MLSRGASSSSTGLRRSKSSASVNRRRHEPLAKENIDPETARQHALTAAHIAMGRARERASTEIKRSTELSRSNSNVSRNGVAATPRSQNIRFCDAVEPRRQRSTLQAKPPTVASSVHMPGSNSYSQLLNVGHGPPLNEFGVADGYGSTPSSYRRLRKSKSMLTPRKGVRSIQDLTSHSPGTPRTLRNVKSSFGSHEHGLRLGLKRSMSFLKLSSGNLSRTFKRSHSASEHNDVAVERAREQFMQDIEQQNLRTQPSFLSATKIRQQKAFRKTVRSNPATEYGGGIPFNHQQTKQESKLRSFSASLRDRVRRVLGRSSSKDSNLPIQQLDASRAHFGDYLGGADANISHEEYQTGDPPTRCRGSLYMPSSQKEESMEDLNAMTRSLRSVHSSDSLRSNGRSRMTSWTNSTMTNSLPGRGTPLERKRLSIIQEHGGPHQPSSSIGRHMDEVSATHLPLSARRGNGHLGTPIDSKRVYSALMKRIDLEQEEQNQAKNLTAGTWQNSGQGMAHSAQSFQGGPTVRQVISEESLHTIEPDGQHRQFSLQAPSWHETEGKTPQEIAYENEILENRWSKIPPQEAQQSSFFPFSSENHPQTPSPFKRALAARHEQQGSSGDDDGSVIINRPSQGDTGVETRSESQYSRTTSGQLPMTGMNRSELELGDEPAGIATIIPARVNRYPRPIPSLVQLHKAKSNSSHEWKSWMNSQMTSLDRRNSRSSATHYREGAQIDGADTTIGGRRGSSAGLGRRFSIHRGTSNETPSHERRTSANERFPLVELKEGPRNTTPKARKPSDLMKLASSAATDIKKTTLAAIGINDENARIPHDDGSNSHQLRGKFSQVSFTGGEEPVSTPGRLQYQYQHQPQTKRLARPQSSITIRNHHDRITETSGDESDEVHAPTTSWLVEPFQARANRVSPGPTASRYLAHNENDDENDTALPPIAEKRSRGYKVGMGMPISSKRMVSNFLRSRRRNVSVNKEPAENEQANSSSPAFL